MNRQEKTTIKTNGLSAVAKDEKTTRYHEYMDAFRRNQLDPTQENEAAAQMAYRAYLDICSLYEQAQSGLNDLAVEKRRQS